MQFEHEAKILIKADSSNLEGLFLSFWASLASIFGVLGRNTKQNVLPR